MTGIDMLPVMPATTPDRVSAAWGAVGATTRRAVLAACATSIALSTAVPAPGAVRVSVSVVGALLAVAALVDLREYKLPNALLLAALAAVAVGVLAAWSVVLAASAAAGLLLGGGLMLIVYLIRGVGMGDVKMAGVVGASVGAVELKAVPVSIALAAFAAAAYGLATRRQRMAIGPALWLGWAIAVAACAAGWI